MITHIFATPCFIEKQQQHPGGAMQIENLSQLWESIFSILFETSSGKSILNSSIILCKNNDQYIVIFYLTDSGQNKIEKCFQFNNKGKIERELDPKLFKEPISENGRYIYDKLELKFIRAILLHPPLE